MSRCCHRRTGAALLIALVAVSIVTVGTVGALRSSAAGLAASGGAVFEAQAEALARDLEPVALAALTERGDALFTDAADPSSLVDIIEGAREGVTVRVRALDLSGRLHIAHVRSFAGDGLPEPLQALRGSAPRSGESSGANATLAGVLAAAAEAGADLSSVSEWPAHDTKPHSDSDLPAATIWLTDHGGGALNLATAPLELVRAALKGRGRDPGAAKQILLARERGDPIPSDAVSRLNVRPQGGALVGRLVPLTTTSDAVAFVISVESGGRLARWWVVVESGRASSRRGTIDERYQRSLPSLGEPVKPSAPGRWSVVERRRIAG